MRDQLYGDARDVSKWSLLSRLANDLHIPLVVQVAVWRPDECTSHGLTRHVPDLAEDHVQRFCEQEREALAQAPPGNRLRRVKTLGRVPPDAFRIEVIDQPFSNAADAREAYFSDVCGMLARLVSPSVALLDPDTGIAPATCNASHVTSAEIGRVYAALATGSLLVVYQHRQRDRQWLAKSRERFAAALPAGTRAGDIQGGDVAFFVVRR